MSTVIGAWDVTKRYGDYLALRELDLEVEAGTIFGFVGPSGSGKTTAVRLLTGSERPTSGSVQVLGGDPVAFSPDERARLGYMPQLSVLYPQLSLWQNLTFVASLYGLPFRGRRARISNALQFVDLGPHRKKRLDATSGGMQRRLALAAALLHDPELLFLDEPTAGIDPVLRRRFWHHFGDLRARGRTLFVTTQYVGEASHCDRVGVIADGRMIAVDTPDGLRRRAFGGQIVEVTLGTAPDGALREALIRQDLVRSVETVPGEERVLRLVVDRAATAAPWLQEWFRARGVEVAELREHVPEMDDVFVKLVEGSA